MPERKKLVLRNYWTATAGVAGAALCVLLTLISFFGMSETFDGVPVVDGIAVSFAGALFCWFCLKCTFFAFIEIRDRMIIVKNFFNKDLIPVGMVEKIESGAALGIFLESGKCYGSVSFSSSFAGALAGYPTNLRCAKVLEEYVANEKKGESVPGVATEVVSIPHLNFVFLLLMSFVLFVFSQLV